MRSISVAVVFAFFGTWVAAQTAPLGEFWVQVRAVPSQSQAITEVTRLDNQFENVVGFRIGGGWYGMALGPFDRDTAERERLVLLQQGIVPSDTFVSNGTAFRQQFWPPEGGIPARNIAYVPPSQRANPVEPAEPVIITGDLGGPETIAEARASEALLTRAEKRDLQSALAWAGTYRSTIDGLYGAGTRAAMRDWQILQGLEPTGVMTSGQRAALFVAFNQIFDGLDLQLVDHEDAGISVQVPLALTASATREAPFVKYDAKDGTGVSLILISQTGDRARMQALYDVLQTLSIVPADGPRSIDRRGFDITGKDTIRHTQAFARLNDGMIKGAILVWPADDDQRRVRVAERIFASFTTTDGALPDAYFLDVGDTPPDLVAGLDIRKPKTTLTGTYIDNAGHVLTADMDFASCSRIDAGEDVLLRPVGAENGVALLKAVGAVQPVGLPLFQSVPVQVPARIVVGGYSYGGLLGAPTITAGLVEDTKDLSGDTDVSRLSAVVLDGDIGGPVLDRGGALLGVLLPRPTLNGRTLPPNTQFARSWQSMAGLLSGAGVVPQTTDLAVDMHPEDLTAVVQDFTVVVRCWE